MSKTKTHNLYFDEQKLDDPKASYVAWVDMMGARNSMSQSLAASANHIGRVHLAILLSQTKDVRTYPVMDGAYITSEKRAPIMETLRGFFGLCAEYFEVTDKPEHRFLVRGGLAHGPVVHGSDIPSACNKDLSKNPEYSRNLLFGIPMIQANRSESLAPPFGLYLDESVRSFSEPGAQPFSGVWWKWWSAIPKGFLDRLEEHFHWCEKNWRRIEYKEDRLKEHFDMARQYFGLK
jgi:hypothetical protein